MSVISHEAFTFLAELQENNNKGWFDENRKRYEDHLFKPLKSLAASLSEPVATLLPEFSGKPKISRINNDTRFQKDKPPYKEHMWISFPTGSNSCSDFFVGIGTKGWSAGAGIGSPKREDMDEWRQNLIQRADVWSKYAGVTGLGDEITIHIGDTYKKPLFDNIPDNVSEFVQSKGMWIFTKPKTGFDGIPEQEMFSALGIMLPYYLFMATSSVDIEERLEQLGDKIAPPDKRVGEMWKAL